MIDETKRQRTTQWPSGWGPEGMEIFYVGFGVALGGVGAAVLVTQATKLDQLSASAAWMFLWASVFAFTQCSPRLKKWSGAVRSVYLRPETGAWYPVDDGYREGTVRGVMVPQRKRSLLALIASAALGLAALPLIILEWLPTTAGGGAVFAWICLVAVALALVTVLWMLVVRDRSSNKLIFTEAGLWRSTYTVGSLLPWEQIASVSTTRIEHQMPDVNIHLRDGYQPAVVRFSRISSPFKVAERDEITFPASSYLLDPAAILEVLSHNDEYSDVWATDRGVDCIRSLQDATTWNWTAIG